MKWQFIKDRRRLNVYGTDSERDVLQVKKLIEEEKIPQDIESIVYRKNSTSSTAMIIRGVFLANLLLPEPQETVPRVVRASIKNILRSINKDNKREGLYAGVVFFSITTNRFMFVTPRGRNQPCCFLGDYPVAEGDETPTDIVCRAAEEDTHFEIDPNWLIPLSTIEIANTTYHSFMMLVEKEFTPALSSHLANSIWSNIESMNELRLHPSIKALFEQDPHLRNLAESEVVAEVIESILQQQRDRKE